MRATLEDLLDERRGLRADRGAPADEPRRAPFQMRAVRLRHVRGHRRVPARHGSCAHGPRPACPRWKISTVVADEAHVEHLVDERMRHRVVVAVDLDVVVDVDARLEPVGVDEALGRQRLQGGAVKALEEIAARAPAVALHRPRIERGAAARRCARSAPRG